MKYFATLMFIIAKLLLNKLMNKALNKCMWFNFENTSEKVWVLVFIKALPYRLLLQVLYYKHKSNYFDYLVKLLSVTFNNLDSFGKKILDTKPEQKAQTLLVFDVALSR